MLFQAKLIQASESIHRPVAEVYAFYRDFRNLTRFLGDVIAVEPLRQQRSRWTIRETIRLPLGWIGRATLAAIGKHPAREVSANLHRLKELMEKGRVTDTTYAVPGKFDGPGSYRERIKSR
jgi:uncharacterized membrane protein